MTTLRQLLHTALLLGCLAPPPGGAAAEPRTALVIGNAAYPFAPLSNPVNDASDVAQELRRGGFEVTLRTDADQRSMDEAIHAFGETLKSKGGVGLFYFSGHGVQLDGENYMIPIGERLGGEADLRHRAVNAAAVLDPMAAARNELNIFILDACRDNPFAATTRSMGRGLAKIESNAGLFVSYSTSPGAVALDGDGRNSPYTKHLVSAIGTPDLSLEETFKRTLKGVYQETAGRQIPWISSSFFGEFIFRSTGRAGPSLVPAPQPTVAPVMPPRLVPAPASPSLAGVYRVAGVNPNGTRYSGMAALTPLRDGYQFRWWIGRQVFSGNGRFAGRMLVVDWGQRHPVIYAFGSGALDGEWADGSATERLELYARATETAVPAPEGRYRAAGRNPDGTRYSGTVSIVNQSGRFHVSWRTGSTSYRGTGALQGNLLTIDWGASMPVVYALAADGSLHGLWEGGRGEEVLTPE